MARRENEHVQLPVPNGWFAVEFSRELHEGDVPPRPGRFFLHGLDDGVGVTV